MYHGIVSESVSPVAGRERGAQLYDVDETVFEQHLSYLDSSGEGVEFTFDDGEENNYVKAFPLLKKFQFTGRFFCIVDRIGTQGYCQWSQLKEMQAAGMMIGSHGLTHQILTRLNRDDLIFELKESKRILESHLDCEIDSISIPRGFYNEQVIKVALACGYRRIYVSENNGYLPEGCFARIAVQTNWNVARIKMALEGRQPIKDACLRFMIRTIKKCCGEKNYNRLRRFILCSINRG